MMISAAKPRKVDFPMIITYDIYTQYIGNARDIALLRAKAEGWKGATVLSLSKIDDDMYAVTLSVHK